MNKIPEKVLVGIALIGIAIGSYKNSDFISEEVRKALKKRLVNDRYQQLVINEELEPVNKAMEPTKSPPFYMSTEYDELQKCVKQLSIESGWKVPLSAMTVEERVALSKIEDKIRKDEVLSENEVAFFAVVNGLQKEAVQASAVANNKVALKNAIEAKTVSTLDSLIAKVKKREQAKVDKEEAKLLKAQKHKESIAKSRDRNIIDTPQEAKKAMESIKTNLKSLLPKSMPTKPPIHILGRPNENEVTEAFVTSEPLLLKQKISRQIIRTPSKFNDPGYAQKIRGNQIVYNIHSVEGLENCKAKIIQSFEKNKNQNLVITFKKDNGPNVFTAPIDALLFLSGLVIVSGKVINGMYEIVIGSKDVLLQKAKNTGKQIYYDHLEDLDNSLKTYKYQQSPKNSVNNK